MADLSAEEAQRYDRQIRLWGMEGQRRLKQAKILLLRPRGTLTEVAKNLVLAGIHSLTLWDDHCVTESDLGSQYFLRASDADQSLVESMSKRVHELNPRVEITAVHRPVCDVTADIVAQFDIVCLHTDGSVSEALPLSRICRQNKVVFYATCTHGMDAWIFCDVGIHRFEVDALDEHGHKCKQQKEEEWLSMQQVLEMHSTRLKEEKRTVKQWKRIYDGVFLRLVCQWLSEIQHAKKKTKSQMDAEGSAKAHGLDRQAGEKSPWLKLKAVRDSMLPDPNARLLLTDKDLSEGVMSKDVMPICAILGGVLAQDMIHVISHIHRPIRSFFILDGLTFTGKIV